MVEYFNSIKVQLRLVFKRSYTKRVIFQFHKGTIKTEAKEDCCTAEPNFNSIKVQLRLREPYKEQPNDANFNSIKVQLRPIALGYIISLFPIGFAGVKLRNLIEKMSMGNHIFLCVLRQPLYLLVLQQVKDLNDASERVVCRLEQLHRQLLLQEIVG